ncbi:MAG TPA: hypothetical protein VJO33_03840 [Gemmatimonadaceae bacterium]|nr:hypothetical protein [Gemmatimonadaceae bacterium]
MRSDLLPTITLVAPWRITTVHLRYHLHVGVPELSRDELVWRAGADRTNGVEVSRVVHSMMRQA